MSEFWQEKEAEYLREKKTKRILQDDMKTGEIVAKSIRSLDPALQVIPRNKARREIGQWCRACESFVRIGGKICRCEIVDMSQKKILAWQAQYWSPAYYDIIAPKLGEKVWKV